MEKIKAVLARASSIKRSLGVRVAAGYMRNQDMSLFSAMVHLVGPEQARKAANKLGADAYRSLTRG